MNESNDLGGRFKREKCVRSQKNTPSPSGRRVRRLRRPRTPQDEIGTQGPLSRLRYFEFRFLGARWIISGLRKRRALRPLGIIRLVIRYSQNLPITNLY